MDDYKDMDEALRPMMYDITNDSRRPVTQQDWDEVMGVIAAFGTKREMLKLPDEDTAKRWDFQLALYPNPMRPGECFVCESKEIPAEPMMTYHGRPLYAPYPKTPWHLPSIIPLEFAIELVRRWNRPHGSI